MRGLGFKFWAVKFNSVFVQLIKRLLLTVVSGLISDQGKAKILKLVSITSRLDM